MKRALFLAALLAAGLGTACEARRSDQAIAADFQRLAKADPQLADDAVHAVSEDGRVTLRGYVSSEQARSNAADLAAEIDGVKGVRNEVQVVGSAPPPARESPSPAPPPSDERLSLPPTVEPEPGDLAPSPSVPPNPTPEM
jgi:hypothetical protein